MKYLMYVAGIRDELVWHYEPGLIANSVIEVSVFY